MCVCVCILYVTYKYIICSTVLCRSLLRLLNLEYYVDLVLASFIVVDLDRGM